MKKLLIALMLFVSFKVSAQSDPDSLVKTYANNLITVTIPVKAIALYAYYFQQNFSWANRLAPDGYKSLIGSGTKPDSLVIVTVIATNLSDFINNLLAERYGAIGTYAQSIFNNSPAISGYTALFTQITNIANGAGSQKNAGTYMIWRYNNYTNTLTSLINQYYNAGIYWIQH